MSQFNITRALEKAIAGVVPAIATAWPNMRFKPSPRLPYQKIDFLFAEPENPTFGDGFHRDYGFLQIRLAYPLSMGAAAVTKRAELLRKVFHRGASFEHEAIRAIFYRTPEIRPARVEGGRYAAIVRCRFYSNVRTEDVVHREAQDDITTMADEAIATLISGDSFGVPMFGDALFGGTPLLSFINTPDVAGFDDELLVDVMDGSGIGVAPFGTIKFGGTPLLSYIVTPDNVGMDDQAVATLVSGSAFGQAQFNTVMFGA